MPDKEQNINKNNEEKVSIQSQDQRGFFYRLFNKYKFTKKKRTDLETSAALDKDLSKDHQASTEEIPSYLKSLLEEKNLLKQRNIEINSNNRTFFINYLNEKHRLNSNMPLSEETKAALIEDLDKFYYIPLKTSTCHNFIFDLNITRRELTRLKDDQFLKVNELIAQLTDDATIAITNKYQLLENHTVSEEKLEAIANEVMDLNLDEEMKRAVIAKLELLKEDRATLRKIYRKKQDTLKTQESKTDANLKEITNLVMRIEEKEALRDIIRERAKQQTDKKQENEADIKINGKTIAEVVDDNALLLSRAMNTSLALKENQKVEPKMLSTMAEFIGSRKLNEINRRNIPYMLTLTNEDKKELNEIINGKTTLLSKLPELDRTNPNPIDQVPLPLNQRLSNRGSEQNTLPKPNKNIKQMNSLSQGSAEVSR
ncbi:hypothetical protein ACJZQ5_000766 [Enterococcus hirae]|uniref:Uncharacterized protein n=3 Tax=Enterococcus hirae TaxID=1354 RepID=I6S3Q6_ENTHA|nr:hypothetical protein [Enterococcus hirae]AFM71360.1 hypothetical protein EHR_12465 [Enterococcus hirae ATCC 9790]EMF0307470.1 hypothetical protein [Enterococcus hirae]EMF0458022.1 hypothetical protein [Enterococcus hirae]EOH71297.1 hypothetical protein UAE_01157 [Enterococcus hirae ATCC 9790]EOU07743.1 hypothetical protein I584_01067 [Enterococcus hirae ATCC 9790]